MGLCLTERERKRRLCLFSLEANAHTRTSRARLAGSARIRNKKRRVYSVHTVGVCAHSWSVSQCSSMIRNWFPIGTSKEKWGEQTHDTSLWSKKIADQIPFFLFSPLFSVCLFPTLSLFMPKQSPSLHLFSCFDHGGWEECAINPIRFPFFPCSQWLKQLISESAAELTSIHKKGEKERSPSPVFFFQ